jgi:hypothetical protein
MSQREITVPCGSSIVVRCSHSNASNNQKNKNPNVQGPVNNKKNNNKNNNNKKNTKKNNNKSKSMKNANMPPGPLKNNNAVGERPEPVAEPVKNNNAVGERPDPVAVAGENVIEAMGNNAPGAKNPNANSAPGATKGGKRTRKSNRKKNH